MEESFILGLQSYHWIASSNLLNGEISFFNTDLQSCIYNNTGLPLSSLYVSTIDLGSAVRHGVARANAIPISVPVCVLLPNFLLHQA